jgi:hypothetical protein
MPPKSIPIFRGKLPRRDKIPESNEELIQNRLRDLGISRTTSSPVHSPTVPEFEQLLQDFPRSPTSPSNPISPAEEDRIRGGLMSPTGEFRRASPVISLRLYDLKSG